MGRRVNRRGFNLLCGIEIALWAGVGVFFGLDPKKRNRKFIFKIRTKDGNTIDNILIEASDMENAKYKLQQRYPGCIIIEAREKK